MKFGPGFAFTFFYYFVTGTIIATLVTAKGANVALTSGLPQRVGVVLGLIAGIVGGYCNQTVSCSIVSTEPNRQIAHIKSLLAKMNYDRVEPLELGPDELAVQDNQAQAQTVQAQTVLCYQRSGWRSLFSGKVFLCVGDKEITIAARLLQLKRIQQQLE